MRLSPLLYRPFPSHQLISSSRLRSTCSRNSPTPLVAKRAFSTTPQRMFALTPYRPEQPRTFTHSKSLPRLPVPPLPATLDKYVTSLKPFLLDQAAREGKDERWVEEELGKRREMAIDFEGGLGKTLQERLKDVDRITPNNWLDDHFWLNVAYHSWRVPLPVNSNWWLLMKEDMQIPEEFRSSVPEKGQFTDWQIRRAAKVTQRLVDFKLRLDRQEILPDSSRAGPFEMHQYSRVFGVTRLPRHPSDTLVHSPHPHPAKHIVVMANDHFYSLDVVSSTGGGETGISPQELEKGLWGIAQDAMSRGPAETSIGVLSGDDRDSWTLAREHLLALSPKNRQSITKIEDSLFVLSLDSYTLKSPSFRTSYSDPSKPSTDLDAHIRNASTAGGSGKNRWWDKAVGIHVESNGRASMVGEHSPCDALIPSIVCDYALAEDLDPTTPSQREKAGEAEGPFEWVTDEKVKEMAEKATETVEGIAKDSEGRMLWFDEYGAGWIKNVGKHSPDAYLQMALQLAFHKTHNRPTATYETASTRLFSRGRTEVIRTFSEATWKWVKAMREGNTDPKTLYALLSAATKNHNTLTRESSTGRGIDRHLMGLRLLLRPDLKESHPLFEDELFGKSQEWVLSTSGLSAGDRFYGTGFGAVYPNGYGINYLAGDKLVKFGIESKVSNPETSTETFRENLVQALREMREVCEKGIPPPPSPAAEGEKPKL
ncbi:choline/carnitine O-acyltransferase [Sporobolomyces salmoneus]|uniref:choline/carnitine O-acyltransferase n=1 Tax=Sporobolomyces salmoneus TaxID=183962 RepID=UPI00316BA82D